MLHHIHTHLRAKALVHLILNKAKSNSTPKKVNQSKCLKKTIVHHKKLATDAATAFFEQGNFLNNNKILI